MLSSNTPIKYTPQLHYPFGKVFFNNEIPFGDYPLIIDAFVKNDNNEVVCILYENWVFNRKIAFEYFIRFIHRLEWNEINRFLELKLYESQNDEDFLNFLKYELESIEINREKTKIPSSFYESNEFQMDFLGREIKKERLCLKWVKDKINNPSANKTKAENILWLFKNNQKKVEQFRVCLDLGDITVNGKWNSNSKTLRLIILFLQERDIIKITDRSVVYRIFKNTFKFPGTQRSVQINTNDVVKDEIKLIFNSLT